MFYDCIALYVPFLPSFPWDLLLLVSYESNILNRLSTTHERETLMEHLITFIFLIPFIITGILIEMDIARFIKKRRKKKSLEEVLNELDEGRPLDFPKVDRQSSYRCSYPARKDGGSSMKIYGSNVSVYDKARVRWRSR